MTMVAASTVRLVSAALGQGLTMGTRSPSGAAATAPSLSTLIASTLAVTGVLLTVTAVLYYVKRRQSHARTGPSPITVVDSCRLEPRKTVFLLRVGEGFVLVGSSGDGLQPLGNAVLSAGQLGQWAPLETEPHRAGSRVPSQPSFVNRLLGRRLPTDLAPL